MVSSLWQHCVDELKHQLPDNIFTMWIRPLSAHEQNNELQITAPNDYFASFIEKNYLGVIESLVQQAEPDTNIQVKVRVDKSPTLTSAASDNTGFSDNTTPKNNSREITVISKSGRRFYL